MSKHNKKKKLLKKIVSKGKKFLKKKATDAITGAVEDASKSRDSRTTKAQRKALKRPDADISVKKTFKLGGKKKARQKKKIKKWQAEAAAGKISEQAKFLAMDKKNKNK